MWRVKGWQVLRKYFFHKQKICSALIVIIQWPPSPAFVSPSFSEKQLLAIAANMPPLPICWYYTQYQPKILAQDLAISSICRSNLTIGTEQSVTLRLGKFMLPKNSNKAKVAAALILGCQFESQLARLRMRIGPDFRSRHMAQNPFVSC